MDSFVDKLFISVFEIEDSREDSRVEPVKVEVSCVIESVVVDLLIFVSVFVEIVFIDSIGFDILVSNSLILIK